MKIISEIMYYRFLAVADYESVIRITDSKMTGPIWRQYGERHQLELKMANILKFTSLLLFVHYHLMNLF